MRRVNETVRFSLRCLSILVLGALIGSVGTLGAQGTPVPGDIDRSGTIDDEDMKWLRAYLFGGVAVPTEKRLLDVNQDGRIDVGDVLALGQLIAGKQPVFSPAPRGTTTAQPATTGGAGGGSSKTPIFGPSTPPTAGSTPLPAPSPSIGPGDVDGNGTIDWNDVRFLRDLIAHDEKPPLGLESADVDGDGRLSVNDLAVLVRKLSRKSP